MLYEKNVQLTYNNRINSGNRIVNFKYYVMRKVSLMKLSLQPENILSKEERKKILGGTNGNCYVHCSSGTTSFGSCADEDAKRRACHGSTPSYCTCEGVDIY
jgi:hypothetical protein